MAKSLCHLLMKVKYVIVTDFNVANMSFNAIRENFQIDSRHAESIYEVLPILMQDSIFSIDSEALWKTGYSLVTDQSDELILCCSHNRTFSCYGWHKL